MKQSRLIAVIGGNSQIFTSYGTSKDEGRGETKRKNKREKTAIKKSQARDRARTSRAPSRQNTPNREHTVHVSRQPQCGHADIKNAPPFFFSPGGYIGS